MSAVAFQIIALASIVESPSNPRRNYDENALAELAASIKEKGVLQPVLVRPLPKGKGRPKKDAPEFELVCGSRRFRGSKLAEQEQIPAIVRELNDVEVLEVQVIENLQRADVHPLEEAECYAQLIRSGGYTEQTIADRIGKSHTYVHRRLGLARLEPLPREAFAKELISISHAILISKLDPVDQDPAVAAVLGQQEPGQPLQLRRGQALSPKGLRDWIISSVYMSMPAAAFDTEDAELTPAGPCSTCPKRTSVAAALFPEFEGEDRCTDRVCWGAKIDASIAKIQQRFKESGRPLSLLSREWSNASKGLLDYSKWDPVVLKGEATTCPNCNGDGYFDAESMDDDERHCERCGGSGEVTAAPDIEGDLPDGVSHGLVVEGSDRGKLTLFKMRPDFSGRSSGSTSGERTEADRQKAAERREELRKLRAENVARQRIYDACVQAIADGRSELLNGPVAAALVLKLIQHNKCDSQKKAKHPGPDFRELRKQHGCDPYQSYGYKSEVPSAKHLAKLPIPSPELARLALDAIAIDEVPVHDYHRPSGFALLAFAEALGIDTELIRKEADWECLSKKQQKERLEAVEANKKKPEPKQQKKPEPKQQKADSKPSAKPKAKSKSAEKAKAAKS